MRLSIRANSQNACNWSRLRCFFNFFQIWLGLKTWRTGISQPGSNSVGKEVYYDLEQDSHVKLTEISLVMDMMINCTSLQVIISTSISALLMVLTNWWPNTSCQNILGSSGNLRHFYYYCAFRDVDVDNTENVRNLLSVKLELTKLCCSG